MIGLLLRLVCSRFALVAAAATALVAAIRFAAPEPQAMANSLSASLAGHLTAILDQAPATWPGLPPQAEARPLVLVDHLYGDPWQAEGFLVHEALRTAIRQRNVWRVPDHDLLTRAQRALGLPPAGAQPIPEPDRPAALRQAGAAALLSGRIHRLGHQDGQPQIDLGLVLTAADGRQLWTSPVRTASDTAGRTWRESLGRLSLLALILLALPILAYPWLKPGLDRQSNRLNALMLTVLVLATTLAAWWILGVRGWLAWPLMLTTILAATAWNTWVLNRWEARRKAGG